MSWSDGLSVRITATLLVSGQVSVGFLKVIKQTNKEKCKNKNKK